MSSKTPPHPGAGKQPQIPNHQAPHKRTAAEIDRKQAAHQK